MFGDKSYGGMQKYIPNHRMGKRDGKKAFITEHKTR